MRPISDGNLCHGSQCLYLPLVAEPRQAPLAGEQFLHGTLFEVALFDEELLKGFYEGIRIAQGPGNGFLFGFGWRHRHTNLLITPAME